MESPGITKQKTIVKVGDIQHQEMLKKQFMGIKATNWIVMAAVVSSFMLPKIKSFCANVFQDSPKSFTVHVNYISFKKSSCKSLERLELCQDTYHSNATLTTFFEIIRSRGEALYLIRA